MILHTFGVDVGEVQLLDLPGPRHGRQHLEGVLAVGPVAAVDAELQEAAERLETLELACGVSAVAEKRVEGNRMGL